jgi:hypothetical protein
MLYDDTKTPIKSATATKRETKKDFPDFTEKAESSAIFRALAMLGMGTQHATIEFEEGERLVDSPVHLPKKTEVTVTTPVVTTQTVQKQEVEEVSKKVTSFRKPAKKAESAGSNNESSGNGWE